MEERATAERFRADMFGTARISPYMRFGELGPRQVRLLYRKWHCTFCFLPIDNEDKEYHTRLTIVAIKLIGLSSMSQS